MQQRRSKCAECGGSTVPVENLLDESEHEAVEQSGHVRYWKSPELRSHGSIAASKRF
jgi:hypothetical protein